MNHSEKEPGLVELLSDPAARAEWDRMMASFRRPKSRKATVPASKTAEIKASLDGALFDVQAPKNGALPLAQEVDNLGGRGHIKQEATVIDKDTGEEKVRMMSISRYNIAGQKMREPGFYWTDARGIALSVEETHAHVLRKHFSDSYTGLGVSSSEHGGVWTGLSGPIEVFPSGEIRPETWNSGYTLGSEEEDTPKVSSGRKWIFDTSLSRLARKLLYTESWVRVGRSGAWVSEDISEVDSNKIRAKNHQLESAALERAWERVQAILDKFQVAPETIILLPETSQFRTAKSLLPESPTEEMGILEKFHMGRASRLDREKKAAKIQAQADERLAEIARLQAELKPIKLEIKRLRLNKTGLVRQGHTILFKEEVMWPLEEKARELRSDLYYEREMLAELRAK